MTWYYCGNAAHARPLFFHAPAAIGPPTCSTAAHGATLATHNVVRFQHDAGQPSAYAISWDDDGAGQLRLKMVRTVGPRIFEVLIPDDVLSTDTPAATFATTTELTPPGGGRWVDPGIRGHAGGVPGGGVVPLTLDNPRLMLGNEGAPPQFGLVHILSHHAAAFNNMNNLPAGVRITLDRLRDNLREVTGPAVAGRGIRRVVRQADNSRSAVHGITAAGQRGLLIVNRDAPPKIVTFFRSNVIAGVGHVPVVIKTWLHG